MRRVASINRTAGRGTLSARSGRTPRIPEWLFVCSSRERERERERAHATKVSVTSHAITRGKKKTKKFKIQNRISNKRTPIVFTSKHIVKDSSNIERSSFTREKDLLFASSSVVSIFVVVISIRSQLMMTTRSSYTNEETNRSFCRWGGCSFFFVLISDSKRQTLLSALSYSYLGFKFISLTLFHLLSASAVLEKNKKNVQKSRPKRGKIFHSHHTV